MKDKAIAAIRKFFEDYGTGLITGTLSEPVDNEWDDERFTAEATIGWLSIEVDHSSKGWLKQRPGVVGDDREGPYEASEPHFIVKVSISEDAATTQAQVAFLDLLPADKVLVALSSTDYEYFDYTAEVIKELLG